MKKTSHALATDEDAPTGADPGARAGSPAGEAAAVRSPPPSGDPAPARSSGALGAAMRPAWAEVDLDALVGNLARLRERVAPAGVLAVIKADAYGHGAPAAARALEDAGVDQVGVALLEEGAELRREGVRLPILVLGTAQASQLPLYRRYRLTPTVSSLDQLDLWQAYARRAGGDGGPIEVHLKIDTGMRRLGVPLEAAPIALDRLRCDPRLALVGLASHFAEADRPESARNQRQHRRFADLVESLPAAERERLILHAANSAAALHLPATRHRMVRLGLALFGLDPAAPEPAGRPDAGLVPVMSVVSRIVQLRQVEPGGAVGYGGRWRAERPSAVAVVPVGYADGYPWRLDGKSGAGRGEALLGDGRRVPLAGSVTMDMLMLDVTGTGARVGDEVVLLGRRGGGEVSAWELAEKAGTIPWEVLCSLGLRLPRRFLRDGEVVEQSRRFSRRMS